MLSAQAFAASYYVNFSTGNNSNAGTSSSAPWKHCPGDANATGVPASKALVAGDTVYFNSGVTYYGEVILKWSGTSGNPITYDGKTWGSGTRATIDGQNRKDGRGFDDTATARSNLVISGIRITNMGGYAEDDPIWSTTTAISAPPGGAGIDLQGGGSNILITDCVFEELGQWQNIQPMSGTTSITGAGVTLQDNKNVTILNCDFTRMKTGVTIKAQTIIDGITIEGCTFHNYMNWLIDIAPRVAGATLRNITIDGCTLYDYKEFDVPNWKGFGEKPHQDGIFLRTSGMASTWENIVIKNTLFYSDQTSNGGTASIYLSQGASADIYNCVFLNDNHSNANINVGYTKMPGMTQTVRVWNCTFFGGSRALKVTPGNTNPDHIEVRNCIMYRTSPYDVVGINPPEIGTLIMDNNVFFGAHAGRAIHNGATYLDFESWKAYSEKDKMSTWADPGLARVSGDPSTWDPRPASTASPAVDIGADLSTFFGIDRDGQLRSGKWDAGAHEYGASGGITVPNTPTLNPTLTP